MVKRVRAYECEMGNHIWCHRPVEYSVEGKPGKERWACGDCKRDMMVRDGEYYVDLAGVVAVSLENDGCLLDRAKAKCRQLAEWLRGV